MKTLKFNNWLNENKPTQTREEVEQHLKDMGVKNYTINEDLTVDVNGKLEITKQSFTRIPVQFGTVTGYFDCSDNKSLESLEGCPSTVTGDFYCTYNKSLRTLKGCPRTVYRNFECSNNKSLESLEGCLDVAYGYFECCENKSLVSLEGCPDVVNGQFNCSNHESLLSLKYGPSTVGGDFTCNGNEVFTFQSFLPALGWTIKGGIDIEHEDYGTIHEYAEDFITEENYMEVYKKIDPSQIPWFKKLCYSKGFDLGLEDSVSNRAARQAGELKRQGLDIF